MARRLARRYGKGTPTSERPKRILHALERALLLRKLSEGATEEGLLESYPHLTREDIKAAIACAADTIAHEEHWTAKTRS